MLLIVSLAALWLAVSAVFLAACISAGRADRAAGRTLKISRRTATVPEPALRLIQREILRG